MRSSSSSSSILAIAILCGAACGRAGPMGPSPIVPTPPSTVPSVPPPPLMFGHFVSGAGAPSLVQPGEVIIVSFSWSDSAQAIADALRAKHAWALVVVADQRPGGGDWERTRAWLRPIEKTGRLVGIYVADEPFHNGWTQDEVSSSVQRVHEAGYRTMVAEASASYIGWRPPCTWFGITAYYDPLLWTLAKYQNDPNLDVVFGTLAAESKWRDFASWVQRPLFLWSYDMGDSSSREASRHARP